MKKKIIRFLFALLLIGCASLSIYYGLYFEKISKPHYIMGVGIDKIKSILDPYFYQIIDYDLEDNFSIQSDITFQLHQDSLEEESSMKKVIEKLNISTHHLFFEQNKDKEQLLLSYEQKLNDENILYSKYYIENSTKYIFVESIMNQYINHGTSNYFENIVQDKSTVQNIEYLYEAIFQSFKNQFSDEYFKTYTVKRKIQGKEQEVNEISLTITNSLLNKIMKGILRDLQQEKETSKILNNIFSNFSKWKWEERKFLIDKDSYTFNIYYSKYFYQLLKVEFISLKDNSNKSYEYEILDENQRKLMIIQDDKVLYDIDVYINGDLVKCTIQDFNGNEVGSFQMKRSKQDIEVSYQLKDEEKDSHINYSSIYKDVSKDKYVNEKKLDFSLKDFNGIIEMNSNVKKDYTMKENIEDALLYDTLKDEEKKKYHDWFQNWKERLEK